MRGLSAQEVAQFRQTTARMIANLEADEAAPSGTEGPA
jgi:hypothetical protein